MTATGVVETSQSLDNERLRPFVPRLAVEWLEREPEVRVREIDGSMVFVDVSGFTKMSERLARRGKVGAEEVTDVIGDTFGTLLAEAYAFGGSLVKFGGDALLLFYDGDGHPHRAAAAAHGMRATLRRIGTFATTAGKVTLRMSVGAHTGAFHFFLVGDSHRELVVAGPAATETVSMEGAASAGQILVSPALAAALPKTNRGRALGPGFLLAGSAPEAERTRPPVVTTDVDLTRLIPLALRETVSEEVEPEHRSVTIAFLHYTDFDEIVTRDGPEAAADALDELVRTTQEAVDSRDVAFLATDIAPDGGKIILTAGAPQVTGSDEEQMLLAARDIVTAEHAVPLHVGVNRGPVFAGAIGPAYRRTYTVMGDAVNLAARLMAKAEIGQVLATPDVLLGSRTLFATTELEPFLVKGKKEPVYASAVEEAQGSRAAIAESGLPLIGRDAELKALLDAWGSSCLGCGRLVEISADPGMGKTRLLQELLSRVGDDVTVARGACRLYQSATPYFPFRALLRQALGLEGLSEAETVAALEALVSERAPQLGPWLSLIATPLDVEIAPSSEVLQLDDRFRRARLEESVDALLAAVLDRPVIMLVEDTHWADDASRDLLARLAGSASDRPWLLVLTRRPAGESLVAEDDESAVGIELQPLALEQASSLIDAATEDRPLMPQQVRDLAERAAGNPLFLIELLDALKRGENVEALPRSVEGLIQARIDRLPPHDRTRLRELSVLGVGFLAEHAGAVLDDTRPKHVQRAIRRLDDFLAVDRKGWVQFRHALIRDAAYEGLPYRARQRLHAQVGDSILKAAGDSPEDQAELLCVHYFHAGRWEEAWTYARVAGDHARDLYANVEAARFYERALTSGTRLGTLPESELADVWRSLGIVREASGEFDHAFGALRMATRLLEGDPDSQARIYELRALARIRVGSYRRALRETASGMRLVDSRHSQAAVTARARLTALRADIRLQQGHARDAIALAEEVVSSTNRADAPGALARAYSVLDGGYLQIGEPEKAVYEGIAAEIYRELGELRSAAIAEMNVGVQAYAEGRWDEAVVRYTTAQEELQRVGDTAQAALAGANLGEVLVSRGALDEAEAVLADARRSARASGLAVAALFAETQLARLQLEQGMLERAIKSLQTVVDGWLAIKHTFLAVDASVYLATAYLRSGSPEDALRVLDDAEQLGGEDAVQLGAAIGRVRAAALLDLGRFEEAEAVAAGALALAREQRLVFEEAQLLLLRAEISRNNGSAAAADELQEAMRLLQLIGVNPR